MKSGRRTIRSKSNYRRKGPVRWKSHRAFFIFAPSGLFHTPNARIDSYLSAIVGQRGEAARYVSQTRLCAEERVLELLYQYFQIVGQYCYELTRCLSLSIMRDGGFPVPKIWRDSIPAGGTMSTKLWCERNNRSCRFRPSSSFPGTLRSPLPFQLSRFCSIAVQNSRAMDKRR